MAPESPVRVRFAPSPTGRLHIGGARTALFNWAFARRHRGVFVLRIEDTDAERNSEESLRSILDSLRWLGLDWDEGPEAGGERGPYFQSQRRELHLQTLERGLDEGWLYRHFTGPREPGAGGEARGPRELARFPDRDLDPAESRRRAEAGAPFVIRFKVPLGEEILVEDGIRGAVRYRSDEVEDWVAGRSDASPTYNFVCVLDDAAMGITHVLRGEEHLVNTPKQVLLYRALGLEPPAFAHLPLILGQDGRKLSKRTGDTAVEDYRERGFPPEALLNFLALLGFSIDDHTTVFGREELVRHFDLARVNKAGAVFDEDKLRWLSGEYIRSTPVPELAERILPWLRREGWFPEGELPDPERDRLERAAAAVRERIQTYGEAPERLRWAFETPDPDARALQALGQEGAAGLLEAAAAALEREAAFPPADFDAWARDLAAGLEVAAGRILKPLRAALTGTLGGPPLAEILGLLGREEALERIRRAAARAGGAAAAS